MSHVWFTSDTHYNHENIVRGVSKWKTELSNGQSSEQRTRDFKTLEEHNAALVDNINKSVKGNDTLYHLGDWSFGGINSIWEFRRQINCKNVHLILGNHDHHIENNRMLPNAWVNQRGEVVDTNNSTSDWDEQVKAKNLFNSVSNVLHKKIGGKDFVLCHYAMRTWDKAHHGTIMLYGHSHGTLDDYSKPVYANGTCVNRLLFKTMDVGVDTHKEFRPYHIDEIAKIMEKRSPLLVDHHNEKTN